MGLISEIAKDRVKQANPLIDYIRNRGIKLTKKGKQYFCRCPLPTHQEENASCSIDPQKQLWNCFGCNEGGDIYQLVMKLEGIDFPEAHRRLGGETSHHKENNNNESSTTTLIQQLQALLRYCQYYHQQLLQTIKPQDYLISRGISQLAMTTFQIGYIDGSIIDKLSPTDYQSLTDIGVINIGRELMQDCVIFPLVSAESNQIISIYGRSIAGNQHLYLSGKRRGVINPTGAKHCDELIIVESVIDALALWSIGIRNVMPAYGTNGLTDEIIDHLKACRVRKTILMLDNDQAGEQGSIRMKQRLSQDGIESNIIKLSAKDPAEFVVKGGKAEEIKTLILSASNQHHSSISNKVSSINNHQANGKREDDGTILFQLGKREYQIKGLTSTGLDRLKVNIRVRNNGHFFIDTIDLYQSDRRTRFAQGAAKRLSETVSQLETELMDLIEPLEEMRLQMRKKGSNKEEKTPMTSEEMSAALEQLRDANLMNWIVESVRKRGHINDHNTIALTYLSMTSRKLISKKTKPLSVMIIARSGSGKSALQEAICELIPPEDLMKVTRLTGQALFYKDPYSLQRKVLAIAEVEGAIQAFYSLRTLVSEQYLSIAAPRTDPQTGRLHTEHYELFGPVSVITSTTSADAFDEETRNRFVQLTMDESAQQTRAILAEQRKSHTLSGMKSEIEQESLQKLHHNIQRLLKPVRVYNPFVEQLNYPSDRLISRREQEKYLSLIATIALLHQYQREVKEAEDGSEYVEVTKADIKLANEIARALLWRSFDELAAPVRGMFQEIIKMIKEKAQIEGIDFYEICLSRREIRKLTGWSEWQVRAYCDKLVELEYLQIVNGGQGKATLYKLVTPIDEAQPELIGLTDL